jgi:hypothetical protein
MVLLLAAWGCTRGDPPHVSTVDSVEPIPPPPALDASDDEASAPAVDPATLPQTRDMPAPVGAVEQRARSLFEAIVKDDPELGMPFFFPLGAYEQTKAVAHPAADWKHRLVANYTRDIHALHKKLGSRASKAVFIGLDVPTENARWVEPGEEGNKGGYYRVFGARLRYEISGRSAAFDITSMISWRGEWYVVHLSGFK